MKAHNDTASHFHVGTSGWSYKDWKEVFYPSFLKPTEYLSYYAQFFKAVEINSSFYHLPLLKTVENWANMVPDDFKFCPKMSRYVTHYSKLNDVDALQRFFDVFAPMKDKLGPILFQLPYSLSFDALKAEHFFGLLNKDYSSYHFAFEARHISWFTPIGIELLKKHEIMMVTSSSDGRFPYTEEVTTNDVYYRFHGPGSLYSSLYDEETMKKYSVKFKQLLRTQHNVWAFFNNDFYGYGLANAMTIEEFI